MPATTTKRGNKFRVVESNGRLVRNKAGTPVDGGGHTTEGEAKAQANAINSPNSRKASFT